MSGIKEFFSGKNLVRTIAILLAVTAVVVLIIFVVKQQREAAKYEFTYKNSQLYKVPGTKSGRGITFKKPDVFTFNVSGENTDKLRGFIQPLKDPKAEEVIALSRLKVEIREFPRGPSAQLIKVISDAMNQPNGSKDYETVVLMPHAFASTAMQQPGAKMEFSYAKQFTNPSITSNAWQYDVSVSFPKNGPQKNHKGKLVYIFGKNSAYFFYISAVESNWDNNSQFFQEIIDSIKINQ